MRRWLSGVALVVVAAGGVTACGGSDDETDSPTVKGDATSTSSSPAQAAQHPDELVGEVGKDDAFSISITDGNRQDVTTLEAGTYKLTVSDLSGIHNFHLTGAGVNESTSVGDTKTVTWTVKLQPGEYTFVCDPHASSMKGSFTVR